MMNRGIYSMKRNCTIAITILLLGLIVFLIVASKVLPKVYVGRFKDGFLYLTPSFENNDSETVYAARYDVTIDEWNEIKKKLTEYEVVTNEEKVSWCLELDADRCFSDEEISNMMLVYRINRYVRLPIKRYWFRSLVSVCPNDEGVSVYFAAYLLDGRTK